MSAIGWQWMVRVIRERARMRAIERRIQAEWRLRDVERRAVHHG